jgi:hypothetical protein
MTQRFFGPWKEVAVGGVLGGLALLLLVVPGTPAWLRGGIVALGVVGPWLPLLALLPWHFVAQHRGLARRSPSRCAVSLEDGFLLVTRGESRTRHALDAVIHARLARNGNWTESKLLEDALTLFAANGREMVRLPLSASGIDSVLHALEARGIVVRHVEVSAPAVLD